MEEKIINTYEAILQMTDKNKALIEMDCDLCARNLRILAHIKIRRF